VDEHDRGEVRSVNNVCWQVEELNPDELSVKRAVAEFIERVNDSLEILPPPFYDLVKSMAIDSVGGLKSPFHWRDINAPRLSTQSSC
jgi:hypothetical protein